MSIDVQFSVLDILA